MFTTVTLAIIQDLYSSTPLKYFFNISGDCPNIKVFAEDMAFIFNFSTWCSSIFSLYNSYLGTRVGRSVPKMSKGFTLE